VVCSRANKSLAASAVVFIAAGFVEGHDDERSLPQFFREGVVEELLQPGACDIDGSVVPIVVHVGRIERVRH